MTLLSSWMTRCDPQLRNGLESPDYDEMLAAYLTLVDNHCLNLIPIPASNTVPAIPSHIDNRAVYNSWAGEYVIDYEAWVNNFPKSTCTFPRRGGSGLFIISRERIFTHDMGRYRRHPGGQRR